MLVGLGGILLNVNTLVWGHVDLEPRQSFPNKWETYTLNVPTEPETPTVRVRLVVPREFEIEMIEHRPAWQIDTRRDERGYIREITWHGGRIPSKMFEEFKILTRNAKTPGAYVWQIEQVYESGEPGMWEARTQIIAAAQADGPRAEKAWRAAQVATTVSLVAIGIAIALILVTLIGIIQRGRSPAGGEPV